MRQVSAKGHEWTGCGMKAIMFKHLMEYYLDKAMCME